MSSRTFEISRSTTVAAPPERVFALLEDFRQWPRWSPWEGLDPALERTYTGPATGLGSTYSWSGNRRAGRGRMEITALEPGRRVEIDLRFEKPFPSHDQTVLALEPTDGGTEVTWTMTGPVSRLMRVMNLFGGMDRLVGSDFEKGLFQLRKAVEE